MNKYQITPRPTLVFGGATPATVAGQRQFSKQINGRQGYSWLLTARARLRILNNAATLLRNRASVWALFNEVGIDENGTDTMIMDGRVLRYLSEVHAPSTLTAVRGATGIATYNLSEAAVIMGSHPLMAQPHEMTYIEKDAEQTLNVFATLHAGLDQRLVTPGAGGAGVDAIVDTVTITVQQINDPFTSSLPLFVPRIRQMTRAINSTNTQEQIDIDATNPIRGIALQQDCSLGEVSDIITALTMRADGGDIIGPGLVPWDEFLRLQETEYGGAVYGDSATAASATGKPGGNAFINFQRGGRLSNMLNPQQAVNLRFELSVTPTALATATGSTVRLTIVEAARIQGLVNPNLPFPV